MIEAAGNADKAKFCREDNCGRPRCAYCNTVFTESPANLCEDCGPIKCISCGEMSKMGRVSSKNEFVCLNCLVAYNPPSSEEGRVYSPIGQIHIPTCASDGCNNKVLHEGNTCSKCSEYKKCPGCETSRIKIREAFCSICLNRISKNLCTYCAETIDPDLGANGRGHCQDCVEADKYLLGKVGEISKKEYRKRKILNRNTKKYRNNAWNID